MASTFQIAVRYPDRQALADAYDVVAGVLALPMDVAPAPGTRALIDVTMGRHRVQLLGEITKAVRAGRAVPGLALRPDGRSRLERALVPPLPSRKLEVPVRLDDERLTVEVPALVAGRTVARVRNLSAGGAKLAFARGQAPAEGALVHLTLLPTGAVAIPAPVIARVAWRSADGSSAGFSFVPGAARSVQIVLRYAAEAVERPIAA